MTDSKQFQLILRKQIISEHGIDKDGLDIRKRTIGMGQQIKHD